MNKEKAMKDIMELIESEYLSPDFVIRHIQGLDWRDEHEKKIDKYVGIFIDGAIRTEYDEYADFRHNGERKLKDVKYYCEKFIKEDFIGVQKPFWEYYKQEFANLKSYTRWKDHNGYSHDVQGKPVTTKEIYDTIKAIKDEQKSRKETNPA